MKRLICLSLIFILISSLATPVFALSTNSSESTDLILNLEYMDFYNNQDYYRTLARENGYTLVISVDDEYIELEKERISSNNSKNRAVVDSDIIPYGSSAPTTPWNCYEKNKRTFSTDNANTTVYMNYYVIGSTTYEVSCTNLYSHAAITYKTHGNSSGTQTVSVPKSSTVIKCFSVDTDRTPFYLSFPAPSRTEGYVDCAFGLP